LDAFEPALRGLSCDGPATPAPPVASSLAWLVPALPLIPAASVLAWSLVAGRPAQPNGKTNQRPTPATHRADPNVVIACLPAGRSASVYVPAHRCPRRAGRLERDGSSAPGKSIRLNYLISQ